MHCRAFSLFAFALMTSATMASGAAADTASSGTARPAPVGMIDDSPCPPPKALGAEEIGFFAAFLDPAPMPPALMAKYLSPEAVAARAKTDAEQRERDWPNLCKYRDANRALGGQPRPRVVFMGDSLTELWTAADPSFFSNGIVGRGIAGQTTPQMLARFYADVVSLHPRVVHIMGGANDIAGNTGPTTPQDFKNNIMAMVDLARANGIQVVLGNITPSVGYLWQPSVKPAPRIAELNAWLRAFAAERHIVFADYHAALADQNGAFRAGLTKDGTHTNRLGYEAMRPLAERAIEEALRTAP